MSLASLHVAEVPSRPADPVAALSRFAASCCPDSIPDRVRTRARLHILDAVGIAIAAGKFNFARQTLSAVLALEGAGDVPVIRQGMRLSPRGAALVNGFLCHSLDFDDTHLDGILHPTASLLPCCLSAALHAGASVGALLTAYIVGVEAATRLGAAAKAGFHQVGFHPTSVVGVFGCALAAGKLLDLSESALAKAQGIALSMAAGSMEFLEDGAWNKRLHPGLAAENGLLAAMLAKEGFAGITNPYLGRFGLFRSYLGPRFEQCDFALATAGLGETWELERTAIKPFAACHLTHGAIDAALVLHTRLADPSALRAVRVLIPEPIVGIVCEPEGNKKRPANSYDAQFSLHYLVATALRRGRFTLAELEDQALHDPRTLALCDRVSYALDPHSSFPKAYSGEVEITLADGSTMSHRENINRGAAERPLSAEDIRRKFQENATTVMSQASAERVEQAVLQTADHEPTATLAHVLAGREASQ